MRVCFVYQADYPWDVRVEKIARTLTDNGHQVRIVSANERRQPRWEKRPEAEVMRLPALAKVPGPLNEAANFPAFFNPLWLSAINRCVRDHRSDLILVRDLPLALAAVYIGRRHKIPVIMDMAECYPELLRSMWQFGAGGIVKRLTHNPRLGDWVERKALQLLDHTFVMVEESRQRWLALGAEPGRVSIVSNTPPLSKFAASDQEREQRYKGEALRLLYAGWVSKGRGLDGVIDGVAAFVTSNRTQVQLTVIGDGDGLDDCRQKVRAYGLDSIVDIMGWQDNSVVVEYVRKANVGLVPHHLCGHWNHTVPNKLFDYMAAGLPVLSSNTRPVTRILTETGAGLVYQDRNADSFRQALERLVSPDCRRELGEKGQQAVRQRYNWERDSEQLLADIAMVTARSRQTNSSERGIGESRA